MLLEAEAIYESGGQKLDKPLPLVEYQRVSVQIHPQINRMSQAEWRELVRSTAGKWEGDFQRADQGNYDEREPLL